MKRYLLWAVLLLTAAVLVFGCSSPMAKAQKLYNDGKYEDVIAQFGADPTVSAVVMQAKEKLAEKMLMEGKFDSVLVRFPETAAAKTAKDKKAEQLFMMGNYQEVVMKYMDTSWGPQAKMKMDSIAAAGNKPGDMKPGQPGKPGTPPPAPAAKKTAAQNELDRIMTIKVKAVRNKALNDFAANPQYAGTKAVAKAQAELAK